MVVGTAAMMLFVVVDTEFVGDCWSAVEEGWTVAVTVLMTVVVATAAKDDTIGVA